MLMRSLMFVFLSGVVALQMSSSFESWQNTLGDEPAGKADPVANATVPSGTSILKADAVGHYRGLFKLNGKPVEGMVDTGASAVAINESTARRLGYGAAALDFRYTVNTANGRSEAAVVKLKRVEVGSIKIEDVDALVLRDDALSDTLIGMSFLSRLSSYKAERRSLTMVH
ncbi:MAG: TIGR02281 family clan AA aspartic protease [Rhizobiaceae bacterium]|nr:TIGR02281 family clan AA aspartic protease [Rhizobiaceae bacterium]